LLDLLPELRVYRSPLVPEFWNYWWFVHSHN
jgi:hypothetical protein